MLNYSCLGKPGCGYAELQLLGKPGCGYECKIRIIDENAHCVANPLCFATRVESCVGSNFNYSGIFMVLRKLIVNFHFYASVILSTLTPIVDATIKKHPKEREQDAVNSSVSGHIIRICLFLVELFIWI